MNYNDNKEFWKTIRPFLTDKGNISRKITLVESGEIISDEKTVTETLNSFFSDTVKNLKIKENKYLLNPTDNIHDPIEI